MNMLIDTGLIVILIYFAVRFYKCGILGTLLGVCRFFFSLVSVVFLSGYVSKHLISVVLSRFDLGWGENILSLIISGALVFGVTLLISTVVVRAVRKAEGQIVLRIDRFFGALFGIAVGLCVSSLICTALHSVIEVAYSVSGNEEILSVYNDSFVFKLIFDLSVFDHVKNLIY